MLTLSEIENYYPEELRGYKRFIAREYLQYKILQIIFDSEHATKLCFLGGTCLRIVHGNRRFSEDIDFDNFNITENGFEQISAVIKKQLELEGYDITIKTVFKNAYHCFIRFPGLLYKEGLSAYKEEKILIQLDTEPQHFDFKPDKFILNRFDVFTEILVTPPDILLAQKFYAICNRKKNKGRDFFDVAFLLSIVAKPNYDYLRLKLSVSNEKQLKEKILEKCSVINMAEMAKDAAPFLFDIKDTKKITLFPELIKQARL